MEDNRLSMVREADAAGASLVLGFSGWMDGGDVSTGTVRYLIDKLHAHELARVNPEGFYIYSFPGSMEVTSMFRPHCRVEKGIIAEFEPPANTFYWAELQNLILFLGKEPNTGWQAYSNAVFEICRRYEVSQIFFVGSVASAAPHTREPRVSCSASTEEFRDRLSEVGLRPVDYEGPASFVTYLTVRAAERGFRMATLVAGLPAYVQGYNPRCVLTMVRLLGGFLDLHLKVSDLQGLADAYLDKLNELVAGEEELAEKIAELERQYDREEFDREMGGLSDWLGERGLRVE